MSTRGCIARLIDRERGQFKGVFHHWDSYPSGLGKTLFDLRRTRFGGSTKDMLKVLIDDHPAGWENINGVDWNLKPGYYYKDDFPGQGNPRCMRPQCRCHGEQGCPPDEFTEENADAEYVYAFTENDSKMLILCPYLKDVFKVQRTFGVEPWDRLILAEIDLNGDEPNWQALNPEELRG